MKKSEIPNFFLWNNIFSAKMDFLLHIVGPTKGNSKCSQNSQFTYRGLHIRLKHLWSVDLYRRLLISCSSEDDDEWGGSMHWSSWNWWWSITDGAFWECCSGIFLLHISPQFVLLLASYSRHLTWGMMKMKRRQKWLLIKTK